MMQFNCEFFNFVSNFSFYASAKIKCSETADRSTSVRGLASDMQPDSLSEQLDRPLKRQRTFSDLCDNSHIADGTNGGACTGIGTQGREGLDEEHCEVSPPNSHSDEHRKLGKLGMIDRNEFVRLLQQSLVHLGFPQVASSLQQCSRVDCHPPHWLALERAVMGGEWEGAAQLVGSAQLGLAIPIREQARFMVWEGLFLEALHGGDTAAALACLRGKLGQVGGEGSAARLRCLASCLLCTTQRDLLRRSMWGAGPASPEHPSRGGGWGQGGSSGEGRAGPAGVAGEAAAAAGSGPRSGTRGSSQPALDSAQRGGGTHAECAVPCAASAVPPGASGAGDSVGGGRSLRCPELRSALEAPLACPGGPPPPGGDVPSTEPLRLLRKGTLRRIAALLPPHVLPPPRRLEHLVEQALQRQLEQCPLRNDPLASPSLLQDYSCGREQLPTTTVQVLREHSDEVWHVAFSPCGSFLASASKDGTVCVYDVPPRGRGPVTVRHVLRAHAGPVAFIAWAPCRQLLASCGADRTVRVWTAGDGGCVAVLTHHSEPVTCAAWLPGGESLVTGSHDKQICQVELGGRVVQRWDTPRVQDLVVAGGGRYILATTSERRVRVYRVADPCTSPSSDEQEGDPLGFFSRPSPPHPSPLPGIGIDESDTIIAMALSQDGNFLLLSLSSQRIHLWDTQALGEGSPHRLPAAPCGAYSPHPQPQRHSRYVVRACLGGLGQKFVLSGSEEGEVYMYHRSTSQLVATMGGHSGTVNAVAWSPTNPLLCASTSDDGTLRVWAPPPRALS